MDQSSFSKVIGLSRNDEAFFLLFPVKYDNFQGNTPTVGCYI